MSPWNICCIPTSIMTTFCIMYFSVSKLIRKYMNIHWYVFITFDCQHYCYALLVYTVYLIACMVLCYKLIYITYDTAYNWLVYTILDSLHEYVLFVIKIYMTACWTLFHRKSWRFEFCWWDNTNYFRYITHIVTYFLCLLISSGIATIDWLM